MTKLTRYAAAVLVGATLALLAGCSTSEPEATPPANTSSSATANSGGAPTKTNGPSKAPQGAPAAGGVQPQ